MVTGVSFPKAKPSSKFIFRGFKIVQFTPEIVLKGRKKIQYLHH